MYTEYLGPIVEDNLLGSQELLQRAARLLQQGALVAIPTETTYGLAASILNAYFCSSKVALMSGVIVQWTTMTRSLPAPTGNSHVPCAGVRASTASLTSPTHLEPHP